MPLEATVLALDNSEWMRNGDFIPSRMEAMRDAANLVCDIKVKQNPESSVGLVAGGGESPKVLCSCTQDAAVLLTAVADLRIQGKFDFSRSLQVAALALKHRRNKNGAQRMVIFVGSPIADDNQKLVKLGKNLKKNNVAVDVVLMGESDANDDKLKAFIEAVDKSSNSHLIVVPTGVLPSDVLLSSPVLTEDMGDAAGGGEGGRVGGGGGQAFAEYGGINPEFDPELAMALRASLEEERAKQEREAAAAAAAAGASGSESGGAAGAAPASASSAAGAAAELPEDMPPLLSGAAAPKPAEEAKPAAATTSSSSAAAASSSAELDEEALLQQALLMSMSDTGAQGETSSAPAASAQAASSGGAGGEAMAVEEEDDEAAAIAKAIAMSQEEDSRQASSAKPAPSTSSSAASAAAPTNPNPAPSAAALAGQFADPAFVNQLLSDLPGVDTSDPAIQQLLAQLNDPNFNAGQGSGANPGGEGSNKKAKKDEGS